MKWATVHKLICAMALLVIGWQIVLEWLLSKDKTGLKLFEGNILFHLLIVLFYVIGITGFVTGYQYAVLERKKSKLFLVSLVCLVLTGLLTVPMAFEHVKDWMQPPSRGIFDNLNFFGTSENRKMLNHQQQIGMTALAVLQIAAVISLIRLRKLFNASA